MKTKKYILEVRKHRKKDLIPNKTTHVIGIFSSVDKAVKWIQSDGQTFFGKKFGSGKDDFQTSVFLGHFLIRNF